ncbi:MAG: DNA polymerase IV [Acidobacteriota bacterium]
MISEAIYRGTRQMPERDIFYLNIAAFQIEVERVVEVRLCERPVAIAIPHSARSTLLEASREAQAEGVSAGMSLGVALRVCRGLVVIPPNPGLYDQASRALGNVVAQFTPVWEPRRPGHVYLDMSGSRRLFGPPRDAAWRLEKEIEREIRLRGSLGLAANKLVSRIAARTVPPRSIIDIERGNESSFLAPLSVDLLPGIGAVRLQALFEELNLKFIGQIASTPLPSLRMVFGAFAIVLHQRALGLDAEPVRPPARRPASDEEITLAEDTNDDIALLGHLYTLVERVAARMRKSNKPATAATLLIRYSDGVEVTRRAPILTPSFWNFELYPEVERLYYKANERRTRVRHMRVSFEHAALATSRQPSQLQLALDEPDIAAERSASLVLALDRIRAKHGFDAIRFGRAA